MARTGLAGICVFAGKGRKVLWQGPFQREDCDGIGNSVRALLTLDELKEVGNEGSRISKEDLRQVQGHPSPRRGAGDLRKLET